jgi:protein SCO1/2
MLGMKPSFARTLSMAAIPVLVVSIFFAVYAIKKSQDAAVLPDYGAAPNFELTDSSGQKFESSSLMGDPWIMTFLFTRCPDQCPLMLTKMTKLSKQVPILKFVSITADPDFDKPEVLAEYVKRGVGPKKWSFLTGEKEKLNQIALDFMTSAPDNPGLHSTRFILVDGSGRIRGFYDSQSKEQMSALVVDARGLLSL